MMMYTTITECGNTINKAEELTHEEYKTLISDQYIKFYRILGKTRISKMKQHKSIIGKISIKSQEKQISITHTFNIFKK